MRAQYPQGFTENHVDIGRRVFGGWVYGQPAEMSAEECGEGRHRPQGETDGAALDDQIGPGGECASYGGARLDSRPVQGDAGPGSAGLSDAGVRRRYESDLQLAVYPGKQGELPIQPLLAGDAECRIRVHTQVVCTAEFVVLHCRDPFVAGAVTRANQQGVIGTMSTDRPDSAMARSRIYGSCKGLHVGWRKGIRGAVGSI
jgi:hypothetical protein